MKQSAFLLAALCSGSLLVASCNSDNTADSVATTETTSPNASTAGDRAGMNHSTMNHGGTTADSTSPLMASMNEMMQKMEATKPKGNTDHDFAHHMLEHHRGAVAMADIELRDGKDATMRQLAERIKADQQKEIAELEAVATRLDNAPTNYKPQDPTDPFTSQMKASMDGMMKNMPQLVADPDMNFNMLMTVHHQSAVDMAKAELAHGRDTKLKEMAQQMINAQQKEIQQFKDWHNQNANKMYSGLPLCFHTFSLPPYRSMKLQHLLLIVAFWLVAPALLLAQRSHKPGTASHGHQAAGETHAHTSPHGGIVRTAGNYHVELVLAQGQLTAYLLDANERTVATAGMTGTALVQQGSKTTSVSLTAAANNALRGALPTGATPTTAIITLHRRNETITARFDKLASTSAKAKAMNYICPMQCEGNESTAPGSCPKCGMALVKKS